MRKGEGWLAAHPEREEVASRYLRHDRRLTRDALARLTDEDSPDPEAVEQVRSNEELEIEAPMRLWEQRIEAVISELRSVDATTVVDLGCGEGKLLKLLLQDKAFTRIVGMDVSWRSLEAARRRLSWDQMPEVQKKRIDLIQGSLTYQDRRLEGFDAATVIEVIEHLDPPRLAAFERVLFECARPKAAIITTPNSEYNARFETLPAGHFRHKDHRFEWSRQEFSTWAHAVAERFGSHAGMKEEIQGRGSGKVREFALYGETTGETDELGLPVRGNWAAEYRGRAMVVHGHTPVAEPEWLNRTINIDTGCVFGGKLTALRYPERELASVAARRTY